MREHLLSHSNMRAALLAEAVAEVAAELRLIDLGDMIGYIREQKWAAIADLVQSSTELSFRDGTLSFACMADFEVDWMKPPSISLEFEFQTTTVSAFFTLSLDQTDSNVALKTVWFASKPDSEAAGTRLLAHALETARQTVHPIDGAP